MLDAIDFLARAALVAAPLAALCSLAHVLLIPEGFFGKGKR